MSRTTTRTRLRAATGGAAATPLVILFLFNLVDEFDRVAFGVLSPEIRDEFGLSDSGIVAIGSVVGITSLLAALPIGVLADRFRRVRMAGIAAATWAVTAVITAIAPSAAVLTVARTVGGVGRVTNEPVHASLLTDYYEPKTHPRVFALHRLANPIGLSSALLIGLLATTLDWRVVMGILAVPTILLLPALLRLREPARGETVDPHAAARAADLGAVGFLDARRQLFAVKTLRRLWVPLPVLGIAILSLAQLTTLFFERSYGFGPAGRGLVTFLSGLGIVVGLAVGQRLAGKALSLGKPELLATYDGMAIVCIGTALLAMVIAPWAWLSMVCYFVVGAATGAYQPCYYSLVGIVSPPRIRAQAYAYALLFLGGGGLFSVLLARLAQAQGYRLALGLLALTLVAGGYVVTTAVRVVRDDADRAAADLAATLAAGVPGQRGPGERGPGERGPQDGPQDGPHVPGETPLPAGVPEAGAEMPAVEAARR